MAVKRIGLDIGSTEVRLAEVEFAGKGPSAGAKGTLTAFARVPLPSGSVQQAEVVDVSAVGAAIKKAFHSGGFSTKEVVVGVCTPAVVVREIELPEMPLSQLRSSLPFQVQEMLPMSADEALLDFYPTGQRDTDNASLLRGILVAAPKGLVAQNVLAVENAGLRPVQVDLGAFALLRAQMTDALAGQVVAFVDIGARTTTVVVAANGSPRLVRMLADGGQSVTTAITSAAKVEVAHAEQLKQQLGSAPPDVRDGVEAALRTLVEGIRNTFVYYASSNPGAAIDQVVITGGGALTHGLGQALASASRLRVTYGNAFARVSAGKKVSRDSLAGLESMVPTAVGLAFGEVS
ncbi:type IV pilus assembly protein PilM [Demequina mangrovi]|uniref:Type IV pilus assembly protein PilM n=1 Tax=Demequina mangrovi TaxID=1043493 RepID=A0A1H6U730_9MICO|nr:type IV pilus assembly protein PilM [Demequina mangrovi]SEI86384.1 type IV pilus assembly protein PilM [Demequina mangrovi]